VPAPKTDTIEGSSLVKRGPNKWHKIIIGGVRLRQIKDKRIPLLRRKNRCSFQDLNNCYEQNSVRLTSPLSRHKLAPAAAKSKAYRAKGARNCKTSPAKEKTFMPLELSGGASATSSYGPRQLCVRTKILIAESPW